MFPTLKDPPRKEFDVIGHGIHLPNYQMEDMPFEHWKREPVSQSANFTVNVTVNSSAVNAADMAEEVGNIIAQKVKQVWINSPVLAR